MLINRSISFTSPVFTASKNECCDVILGAADDVADDDDASLTADAATEEQLMRLIRTMTLEVGAVGRPPSAGGRFFKCKSWNVLS